MRLTTLTMAIILAASLGCGSTSGGGEPKPSGEPEVAKTPDGLVEVEVEGKGHLFLRTEHGIGGYDSIAVAPSFVSYRRTSQRLDPDDEEVYLVSLEQAIIDAAATAGVRIETSVGECVVKVGAGFVNVDLARSSSAKVLGRMTLVIEYQDSMSGESLLRYYTEQHIDREPEGVTREQQVGQTFDRMIEEVNVVAALSAATKIPSKPRAGCDGELVKARPDGGEAS